MAWLFWKLNVMTLDEHTHKTVISTLGEIQIYTLWHYCAIYLVIMLPRIWKINKVKFCYLNADTMYVKKNYI